MPEYGLAEVAEIVRRRVRGQGGGCIGELLTGTLNKRYGQTVLKAAGFSLSDACDSLGEADVEAIAAVIKGWRLPVTGTMPWRHAQVTAGGADVREFDGATMASRRVPGLYAIGEVLDVDGDCGGFNLQWAWASAWAAAQAVDSG